MSRRGRKKNPDKIMGAPLRFVDGFPEDQGVPVLGMPTEESCAAVLPPPEPVPPLKPPWSVDGERGFFFLRYRGGIPTDRTGMAALNMDDEQAALDLCEALNEAHRRRTK